MKAKSTLKEIYSRTRQREKDTKRIALIALVPTLIFSIFVVTNPNNWDLAHLVILPFAMVGFYLIMMMGVFDVFWGYSIYEVLFAPKVKAWNDKRKALSNIPNRVEQIEEKLTEKKQQDTRLENILKRIDNDYQNLNKKEITDIVEEVKNSVDSIKQDVDSLKKALKPTEYPCFNQECKKPFNAIPQDHIFTIAMREVCTVCDRLNMDMFRRWRFDCEYCGTINYIFWHHKDGHTNAEVIHAEKLSYDADEFN